MTPFQLAQRLNTSEKNVRAFLRSPAGLNRKVGKGERWHIPESEVPGLIARFNERRRGSG